jgi:AcrR family transcriptional regulator
MNDDDVQGDPKSGGQRVAFLDAGANLLEEAVTEAALRSLTVRAVTRRAQKSTGAFYHYWETQADFTNDLITHVLEPDAVIEQDPLTPEFRVVATTETTQSEDLRNLFEFACSDLASSRSLRLHLLLSSMEDQTVKDRLRHMYRGYQSAFAAMYEHLFSGTKVRLVDGLDWSDLSFLITSALDGVAIRRRIDPEVATPELVERMLMSILVASFTATDSVSTPSLRVHFSSLFDDLSKTESPS